MLHNQHVVAYWAHAGHIADRALAHWTVPSGALAAPYRARAWITARWLLAEVLRQSRFDPAAL